MKRLLALLALVFLGPAMAQEYVSPYANATQTGNLVPDYSFDGTVGTTPVGWNLQGDNWSGGAIQPGCGALSNLGQCFQFSYMGATLSTSIDLTQYNTKDFEFYFDFYYRMNCNNSIGGYCGNPSGPRDLFGASVQFFTTAGEAGSFNFIPIGTDYFLPGEPGVNEFGYRAVGWYSSQTAQNLFTSAVISFYGQDTGFWGGYYGPALDRVNFHIGYIEAPTIAPSCVTDPWMLQCTLLSLTDPITLATNINTTTDTTTTVTSSTTTETAIIDEPVLVASTTTTDNTGSSNNTETTATNETTLNSSVPTTTATNDTQTALASTDTQASSSLQAQDSSKQLSDGISSSLLQLVLSIVDTTSQQQETKTAATSTTSASVATETAQTASVSEETTDTQAGDISQEILANGVAMNNTSQEELQNNIQDSLALSDQIIQMGNNDTNTVSSAPTTDSTDNIDDPQIMAGNGNEMTNFGNDDNEALDIINNSIIASNNETLEITEEQTQTVASNTTDDTEEQAAVINKTFEDQSDTELLASILESASLAQAVMATMQPYNYEPSVADREMLGVMGKKEEDKSDAEKRADKIVAANKEEQDNIRSNYFEADQAGILGAIEGTTDVSSYRAAVLPDASAWYKSEQIYKNVTYKDNARGLYFLEKGSTDTYKKMVEDQYK